MRKAYILIDINVTRLFFFVFSKKKNIYSLESNQH